MFNVSTYLSFSDFNHEKQQPYADSPSAPMLPPPSFSYNSNNQGQLPYLPVQQIPSRPHSPYQPMMQMQPNTPQNPYQEQMIQPTVYNPNMSMPNSSQAVYQHQTQVIVPKVTVHPQQAEQSSGCSTMDTIIMFVMRCNRYDLDFDRPVSWRERWMFYGLIAFFIFCVS